MILCAVRELNDRADAAAANNPDNKYRDLTALINCPPPTTAGGQPAVPIPHGVPPIADYIQRDKVLRVRRVYAQKNHAAWLAAHGALVERRQQLAAAFRRDRCAANATACKELQGQLVESVRIGAGHERELLETEYLVQKHGEWHCQLAAWVVRHNTAVYKDTKRVKITGLVSEAHRDLVRRRHQTPLRRRLLVDGFRTLGATRPGQIKPLYSDMVRSAWEDNSELEAAIRSIMGKGPKRQTTGWGRFR